MTLEILVKINPDGTMEIEPSGHKGTECLLELKKIIADMEKDGVTVTIDEQKFKAEYYVAANQAQLKSKTR